ncbi:TPA: hypothetical protein N0F65_004999, partial [Lagenidium giganteum]
AWQQGLHQLQPRLALALRKPNNVTQRARLASAIAVPKITFVARHLWPSVDQTDILQRFPTSFVWNCSFDTNAKIQSWLARGRATQPLSQGGLNVPDIHHDLIALAASTVHRMLRHPISRQLPTTTTIQPNTGVEKYSYRSMLLETGVRANKNGISLSGSVNKLLDDMPMQDRSWGASQQRRQAVFAEEVTIFVPERLLRLLRPSGRFSARNSSKQVKAVQPIQHMKRR